MKGQKMDVVEVGVELVEGTKLVWRSLGSGFLCLFLGGGDGDCFDWWMDDHERSMRRRTMRR